MDEYRIVRLSNGGTIRVRRGSPADVAYPQSEELEEPGISRPMRWSLGTLGDFLWMKVAESRPWLAKQLVKELEDAMNVQRELMPLGPLDIADDVLWRRLLKPALDDFPRTGNEVEEYLRVVRLAYLLEGREQKVTRHALLVQILEWLAGPPYREIVEQVDRELADIIRRDVNP